MCTTPIWQRWDHEYRLALNKGSGYNSSIKHDEIEEHLPFPDYYLSGPALLKDWERPFDVFVVLEVKGDQVLLARQRKPVVMLMFGEGQHHDSGETIKYCKQIEFELGRIWLPLAQVVGRYEVPEVKRPPDSGNYSRNQGITRQAIVGKHLVKRPVEYCLDPPLWLRDAIPRQGWILSQWSTAGSEAVTYSF